ncbi:uncharacterized protein [Polyergus mexicanus]|uniref:uncharacterized protein n=1 Tax=Polyergus mexicanus TaxID=615972 RepID=UPI0038B69525
MTDSLQGLLIEQSITISSMKRVFPNFKKMGKANVTQYKAKSRLDALETLWERCQRLNVQLQQIATADEQRTVPYFTEEEFFTAEDVYHEAADYLADVIGKFSRCDPNAASTVSDISSRELSGAVSLQLPRIPLPKFSGNFAEWENFRGIFESLVASKESLSNTQKLHYLKASVTGEAAVLINHVKIADANYDGAWKLLIEEYDNQNAIIHAHIQAFADLPIMKTESAVELKSLRDTVAASLAALTNLGRPVEKWDDLLVYIVSQKFSPRTRNEWNLQRGKSTASPTYEEIRDFMTLRIRGLTDHSKLNADTSSHKNKGSNRASVNNVATEKCLNCSGNHNLMLCDEFKRKSVEQRTQFLKSHKCCFNCLKVGHFPTSCKSKKRCNLCRRAHHTLLHRASNIPVQKIGENSVLENKTLNAQPSGSATPEIKNETAVASVQTIHSPLKNPPNVLLATAWVILRTIEGRKFKVRALLDQGSAVSFISESLCQTMRTKRSRASLHVQCFGERYSGVAKSQVSLTLESCNGRGSSTFSLTAFVYQKITSYAGSKTKTVDYWPHLRKLSLADPDPFSNHPIHLLIGSDLYGSLLKQRVKHGPTGTPTAQLTALGWILSGPTGTSNSITGSATSLNCVTIPSLDSLLQKFWEIEEISSELPLSEEDKKCEQHFIETHQRAEDGRYIIRLPFKTDPPLDLGSSRETAALLYSKLERHFPSEIQALNDKSLLPRSSSLLSLYPFLGKDKLIRLGGRIDNSSLSYDERHPIILPKHRISDLLIAQAHKASLHGGTQLMLRILRQNYWIISARTSVKSLIRSCVKCVREHARTSQQLMGNLPQPRVTPSAPFSHTGVDYAGPMNIIPSVGCGQRSKKYYVAVFICLSTKAVHLEYVDDYATNGFLSAFRRFASRRGLPSDMYSDNGTNFQGADRELNTTFQRLVADPQIQDAIANDNVKWHFIPPSAPHFGGLWEAGVKGLKFHLKRAIGSRTLSQIEFATLLCQIEACLNSRPISALHDDPNDFSALTPGHFLVGRPLVSPPEESVLDIDSNRLSRWQQVRAILEQIWRSWSSDYLHTLQQRRKWQENKPELKINELVLLKNNLAPPSKWELARILDVHPGSDGHVRVVTLRTAKTTLKRPITQICQLPISSDTGS